MNKTGATLNRHNSNPDRGTPPEFIAAVEGRFGSISLDLAATRSNAVAPQWFGPGSKIATDAFNEDWASLVGNLWLNPPFDDIPSFAEKFGRECKNRSWFSFFLSPASNDSNWYQQHIKPNCYVVDLLSRIPFAGDVNGFPKGLILAIAGFGLVGHGEWNWKGITKPWERIPKKKKTPRGVISAARKAGFTLTDAGVWIRTEQLTSAPEAEQSSCNKKG